MKKITGLIAAVAVAMGCGGSDNAGMGETDTMGEPDAASEMMADSMASDSMEEGMPEEMLDEGTAGAVMDEDDEMAGGV